MAHKIIRPLDFLDEIEFSKFIGCSIFLLLFVHSAIFLVIARVATFNGAMYTKSKRQFVYILYSSFKNPKCRTFTRFFHKNLVHCKYSGNSNGRKDNVLNMTNSQYLDYMYKTWLENRKSVSSSWDLYFKLIHANNSKDFRTKPGSIRVSSSSNLITSKLEGMQSNSEFFSD